MPAEVRRATPDDADDISSIIAELIAIALYLIQQLAASRW